MNTRDKEHLQNMYAMVCICIFQGYHYGVFQKGSHVLSTGITLRSGIGFKSTIQRIYPQGKRRS
ncbi:MAG TPA: hypothetical protein VFG45_07570 [Candidatus Nitrosocosmicus sp.]|nr:hypothetical protein [Candidatus Nitrosocosmicus sp.]